MRKRSDAQLPRRHFLNLAATCPCLSILQNRDDLFLIESSSLHCLPSFRPTLTYPRDTSRGKATDALPDFINQRAHDAWSRATFGLTLTIKHLVTLGNWL